MRRIFARYGDPIETLHLAGPDLLADLTGPVEPTIAGCLVVLHDPPVEATTEELERVRDRLATLPCVVASTPGAGTTLATSTNAWHRYHRERAPCTRWRAMN